MKNGLNELNIRARMFFREEHGGELKNVFMRDILDYVERQKEAFATAKGLSCAWCGNTEHKTKGCKYPWVNEELESQFDAWLTSREKELLKCKVKKS